MGVALTHWGLAIKWCIAVQGSRLGRRSVTVAQGCHNIFVFHRQMPLGSRTEGHCG